MSGAPLALTMGEPAGIGGELALKAWQTLCHDGPVFFLIDDPDRVRALAVSLALDVPVSAISKPSKAAAGFAAALPVLAIGEPVSAIPGKPAATTARTVESSIRQAVSLTMAGDASAVITNPIQKSVLADAGFAFPGHTEFLGALAGPDTQTVMMLVGGGLRVVPVTIHVPLADVAQQLTCDLIESTAIVAAEALQRDFGIASPRLALAGLNPHAGEDGLLGKEEQTVITPAIQRLRARGFDATGPIPADAMFHAAARQSYDAAICMYHDQALIPLKTLAFDEGVNTTLGLPFVRTSPDHGTALDIAGKGIAKPDSLIAALKLADHMARQRRGHA